MSLINASQFNYQTPFQMSKAGYTINKPGLDFFFKKTQLPWVGDFDSSPYITDDDMRKLENAMVEDTFAHRHRGFWLDNSAQSFGYLTVSVLLGEGIDCSVEGKDKAEEIIEHWNDEINVKHQSIEDLVTDAWLDNLIDAKSLWRVYVDTEGDDEEHMVDLQRVSMANVEEDIHQTRGWRRFIQRANIPKRKMTTLENYLFLILFFTINN